MSRRKLYPSSRIDRLLFWLGVIGSVLGALMVIAVMSTKDPFPWYYWLTGSCTCLSDP